MIWAQSGGFLAVSAGNNGPDHQDCMLPAEFADVWNEAENPGTVQTALIDMALLSHCNDLVVTMASSFGYVAAAWGGYAPVYMVYGEHTSSQNPYWYR